MSALLSNLTRLPSSNEWHRRADWAEMQCLIAAENEFSVSDLADAFERGHIVKRNPPEARHSSKILASPDDDGTDNSDARDEQAQRNDQHQADADEVFNHLRGRAMRYGECYPFELTDSMNMLRLRSLRFDRNAYIFLLVCSGLQYVINKAESNALTTSFEHLCVEATQRHLGPMAQVHLFGKSADSNNSRYSGKLVDKLRLLASDLSAVTNFDPDEFDERDTGDNGLDVVAWVPPGDDAGGRITFFGQCACTPEWVSKQHAVNDDAWQSILNIVVRPVQACFIPYDYRTPGGSWYKSRFVQRTYVVDRSRILRQLGFMGSQEGAVAPLAPVDRLSDARLNEIIPVNRINALTAIGLASL